MILLNGFTQNPANQGNAYLIHTNMSYKEIKSNFYIK